MTLGPSNKQDYVFTEALKYYSTFHWTWHMAFDDTAKALKADINCDYVATEGHRCLDQSEVTKPKCSSHLLLIRSSGGVKVEASCLCVRQRVCVCLHKKIFVSCFAAKLSNINVFDMLFVFYL